MRLGPGLLGLALLFAAQPGDKASVSDLRVTLEGTEAYLSFRLDMALDEELLSRIQSGLPTGFDFEFSLAREQRRWWWFDRPLRRSRLQVAAMYNAVTRDYLVNYKRNGELVESRTVRELEQLHEAMTGFDRVLAFALDDIETRKKLVVRVRAEIGSKNLFSLIPTTLKTEWAETRKFQIPR
ncbi:MAG: DUF4390 domain-containing protein [Thermoanaerobaculia bacterium]